MYKKKKIAVVIPCYKVSKKINKVINLLPSYLDRIYVVDDKCPENSVKKITSKSKKIKKIYRNKNGGVGAAVKDGYKNSMKDFNHITVRLDGDGQMDPRLIKKFIIPIIEKKADFTKGNRLSRKFINSKMPLARNFGNLFFSLFGRISTKNFHIFDFLNGYTAISYSALKKLRNDFKYLDNDYFFETSTIYYLTKKNLTIKDISMDPIYSDEQSNINVFLTTIKFIFKNFKLILKNFT